MDYRFQFGLVWPDLPTLLHGAWLTFALGVVVFGLALVAGLVLAALRTYGAWPLRRLVDAYVVFLTNTPALVQVFFLYYGLPELGLRWSSETCLVAGLALNASAYLAIILRAGFLSVRATEMEAAAVMGLTRVQQVRYVVAPHIARTLYPALANFFVTVMVMGTSLGALIGVDELTGEAINLSTTSYRWIEFFTVAAGLYVALTFAASLGLALLGRWAFRVKARIF